MEEKATLLIIDMQRAFDDPGWGVRNNPDAEQRVAELLASWRSVHAPIIHVRHRSLHPEGAFTGARFEFKVEAEPQPGEPLIEKHVNSAFIGTDLEHRLKGAGATSIVVAGLTTDHCCSTTARMANNLGFAVKFVADATATFERQVSGGPIFDAETMHQTALASLSREFAEIVTTSVVTQELLGRA